ncbi:Tetratricopeptide repeat-containing protein [Micromonospora sediminimaris]|uniref:Tetratricopeptide repeat-containing protein n=1 Tax=Micromonospora sediminimaris TaxID=547162 RepID=A0A9W5XMJ3_9ACTN|nr:tetratricopeptide repeat protein [Micromonospora sediminimaris]GIJ36500.1 hypothetical protein Vse01_56480 [Micromonospora sediminimaris]SFC62446.1 Tetratricopeptide repeat-containing protein [Micromonospora sediminimaris]
MSADVPTDPPAADGYLERATLLAELGRYDEAVAELGFALALDPAAASVSTMLARVHLAAGRPAEALAAAQAAVAAAPGQVPPLVARGLALGDLERYAEAAGTADEILALGPEDAYAQRSAAAILAGSRNGQPALNAAWRGVELAPDEPQGHLVLGLVAANMRMYDLAERAYREALRLDPRLAETGDDVGVLRLEQRRWSAALARLAEAAVANLPPTDPRRADEMLDESTRPDEIDDQDRPAAAQDESDPPALGHADASRPVDGSEQRPSWPAQGGAVPADGPVPAGGPEPGWRGEARPGQHGVGPVVARQPVPAALRRFVLWGAGWSVVAAVVVACSTATGSGFSRLLAVAAAAGGGIVLWQHAARLPGLTRTILPVLRRTDRPLALAVYAAAAAPVLILLYALFGTPWPLVLAIAIATAARLAIVGRPVA